MIGRIKKFVGFFYSCAVFLFHVVWFLFPYLLAAGCIVGFIYSVSSSESGLSGYQKIDKLKSETTDERWHQSLHEKLSDKKLSHNEVTELENLANQFNKEALVTKLNAK